MNKNDNSMLGAEFMHEVVNVSKIFGRDHDIDVVIQGNMAGINEDGTINYPSIDPLADLTDEQVAVSRGYVDHECGHKRHTNMRDFFGFVRECRESGKNLLTSIANGLEDPRMEAKVIEDYEGAFNNLAATANEVSRSWVENHIEEAAACADKGERSEKWHTYITGALSILGRERCWNFGGKDYRNACKVFEALLGDEVYKECQKWVNQLTTCKNTKDVIRLTRKIGDWIVNHVKQDQDKQQQPDPDAGQDQSGQSQDQQPQSTNQDQDQDSDGLDQDSDGSGSNSDDLDKDSDDTGQDSGDGDKDSDGSAPDNDKGQGNNAQDQDNDADNSQDQDAGQDSQTHVIKDDDPLNDDGKQVDVKDVFSKMMGDASATSSHRYVPFSTRFDKCHTRRDKNALGKMMSNPKNMQTYQDLLEGTAGELNVIRRKLERALQADRNIHWDGGKQHGRLDSRRLVAAFNGHDKVFKKRQDTPTLDTAVSFVLDMSSSMKYSKIDTATQTLLCMAEALEKTSISYNIIGHTIGRDAGNKTKLNRAIEAWRRQIREGKAAFQDFSRFQSLDLFEFKSFSERLVTAKNAIGSIPDIVMKGTRWNGNADSEALWKAYEQLEARPEKRKVMIVLSDGSPNTCTQGAQGKARIALAETVKLLERRGVDVIGIGIEDSSGERLYSNWFTVWNLRDLAQTVIDQVANALLGKKNKVLN